MFSKIREFCDSAVVYLDRISDSMERVARANERSSAAFVKVQEQNLHLSRLAVERHLLETERTRLDIEINKDELARRAREAAGGE